MLKAAAICITIGALQICDSYGPTIKYNTDKDCQVANIYHEARGETLIGQAAVAEVVQNRVNDPRWANNACDVIYQPYQFSWTGDNISDAITDHFSKRNAEYALTLAKYHNFVGPATHYHTTDITPYWSLNPRMEYITTIGNHRFYYEHP